ncbi:sulfotransferase domain-containing protein [Candidatus Palauibacter sp.]|uniref:sulfotransferase domain-containing protein n=1 Tax=Candidatus Palauibacter sp. TaxID=3101350 RepID=UPI003B5B557F
MGEVNRPPRLAPPRTRQRSRPALKRWFGRTKRRAGYYRLRDGLRNRLREPRFLRALRPTDVFLVGHPKSGNTWLAYMLAVFLSDDREGEVNLYNVGDHVPFVHGRDHEIASHGDLPDPRVFRNEYPRHPRRYPLTLYLVRDPRAVLVSFWHMYVTMFADREMTLPIFVDGYLSGTAPFDSWHRHLARWDRQVSVALRRAERGERICIARYEDFVDDREAALRRVAEFIGRVPAGTSPAGSAGGGGAAEGGASFEARLSRAVARGAFEAMKEVEDRHGAEAYVGRARAEGRFIRRGRTDGWKDEMDPGIAARIETAFGQVMERAGYLP